MVEFSTCVAPTGSFVVGVHRSAYRVLNLREQDYLDALGRDRDGRKVTNDANFPETDVVEERADRVYEIRNPFPFRGVTYIAAKWADRNAGAPDRIRLPAPAPVSLREAVGRWSGDARADDIYALLPEPLQLALAVTSTDPEDLVRLASVSCDFVLDPQSRQPQGLYYVTGPDGRTRPDIRNEPLFEAVANNPRLPDAYKQAMVLRPGAQGNSEITAEWRHPEGDDHVFEYLRRNSYIPWGHFAANMANDAVRYRISDLTAADVRGMRHLYYQRTFVRLAEMLGLDPPPRRRTLSPSALEDLRRRLVAIVTDACPANPLPFDATVWGWNFGFDYAPTRYRLHASHQQVHQQYALAPVTVGTTEGPRPSFACGDMVADFIRTYRQQTGRRFFEAYLAAIDDNTRTDGRPGDSSLAVWRDENVLLFVPKAQTSQWELQLMTLKPVANILAADTETRQSLDQGIHTAVTVLSGLGARLITTIEYAGRIAAPAAAGDDQRLVYSFLPRLPESPGAFSEAQLRWINGHYPEDFATACRRLR